MKECSVLIFELAKDSITNLNYKSSRFKRSYFYNLLNKMLEKTIIGRIGVSKSNQYTEKESITQFF